MRVHGPRPQRANLLATMTMGLFISARIDSTDAADVCDSVAAEVAAWSAEQHFPPAGKESAVRGAFSGDLGHRAE